jgi:hypothetical protein
MKRPPTWGAYAKEKSIRLMPGGSLASAFLGGIKVPDNKSSGQNRKVEKPLAHRHQSVTY